MLRTKGRRRRPEMVVNKSLYRVNHQIKSPSVMVINEAGENLGEMPIFKALNLAVEQEMDLVEVFPKSQPPVCKILDYGQFQYQQKRKDQEARTNVKKTELKGIRISYKIGQHDLELRISQAVKFLAKGDKVKVEMILRGREKQYWADAQDKVRDFVSQLQKLTPIIIEQSVKKQGGQVSALVAPKNN